MSSDYNSPTRMPFDGRMSEEEKRLMYDGYGDRGTDYRSMELENMALGNAA